MTPTTLPAMPDWSFLDISPIKKRSPAFETPGSIFYVLYLGWVSRWNFSQ